MTVLAYTSTTMRAKEKRNLSPLQARLLIIAAFVVFWEVAARFWADPMFMAPPSAVLMAFPDLLREPGLMQALARCLYELAAAFAISVAAGMLLGIVIGVPKTFYLLMMPIVIFLFAIPQSSLLSVFTLIFGMGTAAKIAFGVSHGIFPILITTIAAVQKLNPKLMTAARAMGASRLHLLRHVIIPSITPSFFTGLRLGMASTVIGVLLSELYISQQGIGYFTRKFSLDFDPAPLFALIIVLSLMAVAINELIRRLENHFNRWQVQ